MFGNQKQFSLTYAAPSTFGRAKSKISINSFVWCVGVLLLAVGREASGTVINTVINFEGVAPPGGATLENNTTRTFSGFNVFEPYGNYVDSAFPDTTEFPHNGTDYLIVNSTGPMVISHSPGLSFSLFQFEATEYDWSQPGSSPLQVTGHFAAGGTITASFLTAARVQYVTPQFQAFTLPGGWDGLASVDISAPLRGFAIDNVVVAVPEPYSITLILLGSALVCGFRKLYRRGQVGAEAAGSVQGQSHIGRRTH